MDCATGEESHGELSPYLKSTIGSLTSTVDVQDIQEADVKHTLGCVFHVGGDLKFVEMSSGYVGSGSHKPCMHCGWMPSAPDPLQMGQPRSKLAHEKCIRLATEYLNPGRTRKDAAVAAIATQKKISASVQHKEIEYTAVAAAEVASTSKAREEGIKVCPLMS